MTELTEIGWGKYKQFEGPYFIGTHKFRLPAEATEEEKILAVITATEGGHWDAYNGYDVCICTSGLIQWCNRSPQHSVDNLLSRVRMVDRSLIRSVESRAAQCGFKFGEVGGLWRFSRLSDGVPVTSPAMQQDLFFDTASGVKGSWTTPAKLYAKAWAAAISTVWENPEAQRVQAEYTARRLNGFAMRSAQSLFSMAPDTDIARAFRAAYLSFAANNPAWAEKSLAKALKDMSAPQWSLDWLILILKQLTFNPGIAIYPHRYRKIRPVLERLYSIDLPDMADDLQAWKDENGFRDAITTEQLQASLIMLGFDLGPAGADGRWGKKSQGALMDFEEAHNVPEEHQDGIPDRWTIPALEKALEQKGMDLLA